MIFKTIVCLIAALAVIACACGDSDQDGATTSASATAPSISPDTPSPPTPAVEDGSTVVGEGTFSRRSFPEPLPASTPESYR